MRPPHRHPWVSPVVLVLLVCAEPAPAEPAISSAPAARETGSGWLVAGTRPQDYIVELEPEGGREGTLAASLRHRGPGAPQPGFVTLMRWIPPNGYAGKRVRLSAWIRGKAVEGWSGLWMRVDGPEEGKPLAFDNMEERAVRGTRDWRRYEVVLDVGGEARRLNYGILLRGAGHVWVDDFRLETVGPEVPVTARRRGWSEKPRNLDFDHPPEPPP